MDFLMEQGEVWWGGTSANPAFPLTEKSVYHENMLDFSTSSSNQSAPFFVSSHGRYLWSDEPFEVSVEGGAFHITGGCPELVKAGETLREAYLLAQKKHFPCDGRALPDRFFTAPQLNTWMEFTYYVTQQGILDFDHEWVEHGFTPGILTIDEGWQQRYGVWKFRPDTFPDPKAMVEELHEMGFTVLLWVVPYVSVDGPDYVRSLRPLTGTDPETAEHLYLRNEKGEVALFKWWNGVSAMFDLTEEHNIAYLDRQLHTLIEETGVDGFKFDGGSVTGLSHQNIVNGPLAGGHSAHELNKAWNGFGTRYSYHEYKDTYDRGGKNSIQRLRDKWHEWNGKGLGALIPCGMNASMLGHPFLCPDMVGGGEWTYRFKPGFTPDRELFIRMAQCSALFPMMQFSWAPWNVLDEDELRAVLYAAKLHESLKSEILSLVHESEKTGEPIIRPLEYVCPRKGYENVNDEYLLGNDILVAPVLTKGAVTREVVFPDGKWQGRDGMVYEGGTTQTVDAPIEKLPWFRRV